MGADLLSLACCFEADWDCQLWSENDSFTTAGHWLMAHHAATRVAVQLNWINYHWLFVWIISYYFLVGLRYECTMKTNVERPNWIGVPNPNEIQSTLDHKHKLITMWTTWNKHPLKLSSGNVTFYTVYLVSANSTFYQYFCHNCHVNIQCEDKLLMNCN